MEEMTGAGPGGGGGPNVGPIRQADAPARIPMRMKLNRRREIILCSYPRRAVRYLFSVLDFMRLRIVVSTRVQHEALRHREVRGNDGGGRARRCKWDEGQDWHAPRCLRTGHKALLRLVPT